MALNARLSHRSLFFFFIRSSPTHEATNFVYMHNSLWAIKYYYLYAFSSTLCQKNRRKIWWHLERQSFAYLSAASRCVARISPTYLYARFESTMTATPSACLYQKKMSRRNWGSLFYILLNSGIRVMCVMTGNMTKRNENVNAH